VALLAVLLVAPTSSRAEPDGRAELRLGLLRFEYAEYGDRGASLDREMGWVPAVSGEVELRGSRLFGRAAARLAQGNVTYHGRTQSLSDPNLDALPVRSKTDVSFVSGELQGGAFLDGARRLALFVAAGARRWTRDIRDAAVTARDGTPASVTGLSEIYAWYELQAGARFTFLALPRTAWDLEGRVVRTAGADISVDLGRPFGVDGTARMGLGASTGWRAATTLRQDLEPGVFLVVSLFAEGYAFGASHLYVFQDAGGTTRAISEPRSETLGGGLEVGIGGRY
jgi:hypothetical protein